MSKPDDERIWAGIRPGIETWWQRYANHQTREYIRADLHAAEIEALRKENGRLRAHIHRLVYAGSQFEALLLPTGKNYSEYQILHSATAVAWRKARERAERAAIQGETV